MKTIKLLLTLSLLTASLSGCVFNPWRSEFSCPGVEKGKCISVEGAYKEATDSEYRSPFITQKGSGGSPTEVSQKGLTPAEETYQDATYKKLAKLVTKPVTPVMAPADVVRTLIFPYPGADGEELYMPRHTFFVLSKPKFILGNYLVKEGE